ncbi:KR domain-containing protein [Streptomyces spongiicola]|uniref:SDR family NAD(P)-dependent oxidoreductase n=2 Tax=Streptomyces TaxID=1883 RepID=A0A6A0B3X0_9ACTN|nr:MULTISPECIES: oxidoreductase [Streptomyces]GBQ03569.1 KR domain-containing protein [Streptomyces spongiicola]GFH39395.1 SDR family NAD(P)-dependent oxidoreductase [Streptomyces pacificus]
MDWSTADVPDQNGRTALVTGGSGGIGLETARGLAARGARVVLACRSVERGRAAAARIGGRTEVVRLDLASLDSVRQAAAEIQGRYERLDLLVNNAGVMFPPFGRTEDGFEAHFGVNHLGHFALTGLLLGLMRHAPGSRVVTVSSLAHRVGTAGFGDGRARSPDGRRSVRAYGQSKLANLMFARELQRRLAGAGAATVSLAAHPGLSATGLWHGDPPALLRPVAGAALRWIAQPPDRAALPSLRAATDRLVPGGAYLGPRAFFESRGAPVPARSSRESLDASAQVRLWELSQELTGVRYRLAPGGVPAGASEPVTRQTGAAGR